MTKINQGVATRARNRCTHGFLEGPCSKEVVLYRLLVTVRLHKQLRPSLSGKEDTLAAHLTHAGDT